jgi:hypothetical protein
VSDPVEPNPVEPAPIEPAREPLPWREVFGWRFWANYALCLVVTLWIPLAELTMTVDGIAQGKPQRLSMLEIYRQLLENPGVAAGWKFVAAHWGITFVVMALVWWLMLRRVGVARKANN